MPEVAAIPAAAIAAEDANRLARLARSGRRVRVRLVLEARREADVESANVVGEIVGREKPNEIVLLGGHLDSWDVGTGASDDGVGCIITWEAARLMVKLGIRPRRTVRVVLWTNEENGLRGAAAYAERYAASATDHVFALESDLGVFAPAALGFSGSMAARAMIGQIGSCSSRSVFRRSLPAAGELISVPSPRRAGFRRWRISATPRRYFVIHHTAADTVDRILPEEVSKAAAAIAVMVRTQCRDAGTTPASSRRFADRRPRTSTARSP